MEGSMDLSFLLEKSKEGEGPSTSLQWSEDLGRFVVANRDVDSIGGVLLREKPMLIYNDKNNMAQLYDAYLDAPENIQRIALDMYTPPDNSDLMLRAAMMAGRSALFSSGAAKLGQKKMTKLAGVAMTNGFSYYGKPIVYQERATTSSLCNSIGASKGALLAYGSKIAHSCSPNTSQFSKTKDGCMEFKVIRPIKAREPVTISYINDLFSTPTFARRKLLWESKSFFCKCERCMGPDHGRVVKCPSSSNCKGYARCTYDHSTMSPEMAFKRSSPAAAGMMERWVCEKCGPLPSNMVAQIGSTEVKIEGTVSRLEGMLQRGMIHSLFPKDLKKEAQVARRDLSSQHYLTQKILSLTTRVCASHAVGVEEAVQTGMLQHTTSTPYGTSVQLRKTAAITAFEWVSSCECVAVGCSNCSNLLGKRNHPPLLDCAQTILFAWQDLGHVPQEQWPKYATSVFLEPYLPLLRIAYGDTDNDVRDIESHIGKCNKEKYYRSSKITTPEDIGGGEKMICCDYCHKPDEAATKICSRCKKVRYCSKECQVAAWRGGHKKVCTTNKP